MHSSFHMFVEGDDRADVSLMTTSPSMPVCVEFNTKDVAGINPSRIYMSAAMAERLGAQLQERGKSARLRGLVPESRAPLSLPGGGAILFDHEDDVHNLRESETD